MSQTDNNLQEKSSLSQRFFLLRNTTLLAISLSVGAAYAGIGAVATVRVLYAQSRGASLAIISAMASAYLISNFIFQYPSGWLADRWGRKQIMLIGLAAQVVLAAAYIPITDPILFIVLRLVEGIAAAALLPAARALIVDSVPQEQQGKAFGIFTGFFNAGFLLGPGIGGLLAAYGYTAAFLGAIVFRLISLALVLLLVHNVPQRTTRPLVDTSVQDETQNDAAHEQHPTSRKSLFAGAHILFALPLLAAYCIIFGNALYEGFDLTLMPLWMHDHLGASVVTIGIAYVTWALPNAILSPLGGLLADRMSRARLILIFGLAQIPFYITYGLLNTALWVVILFALHGCLFAFMQPAVDAYVALLSPGKMRAQVQGVYSSVGLIGAFAAATAFTPLYGLNFRYPLFAMGIAYALCIILGGMTIYILERQRR